MKLTKQRLKEIIKEELGLGDIQTEPRHEGATPEERLLNKLLIVSKVGSAPDAAAAAKMLGLGEDEEVIAYLDSLMGSQMYAPDLEESSQSGGSSQSKEADQQDPSAHQWSSKGRKKAASKKRRSVEKERIKKGKV